MMSRQSSETIDDAEIPVSFAVVPRSQHEETRDNAEITSLLTPVISECVSAVSTLLVPPPQGEMAVSGAMPTNQPVPLVNPTCMKAACGGALLLAGLAGYGARAFMQGTPAGTQRQETSEPSQHESSQPTWQPRQMQETDVCEEKPTGILSVKKNEIGTLAFGHGGNRVFLKFWSELLQEHKLDTNGKYTGSPDNADLYLSRLGVYMNETTKNERYRPRSVLVDLDLGTMDIVKASPVGRLFRPDYMYFAGDGVGNNFAKGYYTVGAEAKEEVLDMVRKEVENMNCPQGFQIFHTMGGGTGSGLGTLMLKNLLDSYPDRVTNTISICPSPKVSDVVVEPYNAVLTIHQLIENSNSTYIFDNEALYNINQNVLKNRHSEYKDLNDIMTQTMMGATAPFRFQGAEAHNDLRKQASNLIPFPRLHFLHLSHAPLHPKNAPGAKELLDQVRHSRNFLTNIKPTDGKYLATSFNYRGGDPARFFDLVDKIPSDTDKDAFVGWVPDCVMGSAVGEEAGKTSCTMVANTTAIKGVFQRLATQFGRMYRRKAFLHWYKGEGMDEMEFQEADKNVRDLITEYQDKEDAVVDVEEDSDEDDDEFR